MGKRRWSRQLVVGLFVVFGMTLGGIAVFMIGDNRRLWESSMTYRASFMDVAGLKPGAPIRTGGLDVGTVTAVAYSDNAADPRVYVKLSISKKDAARIRLDTVARVANKGLLGDRMIELTVSDGRSPLLESGSLIPSEEPRDMLARANEIADRAQRLVERLDPLAKTLGDPRLSDDIRGSVASMREILDAVSHRDSAAHRLLFDPDMGRDLGLALSHLAHASRELDGVATDLHDVSSRAKTGPGLVHSALYDEGLARDTASTLTEVHRSLRALREGNGIARAVLYGDDKTQHLMKNLDTMSDDLRQIVAGIRAGKGTVGALLVDPSVYEDLKSAIGNVERNQVLRALVRYSIKADEARPRVEPPREAPR